ncbi:PaaI family thioesterase [Myxococcota bacterium]|nr:PaaI family thioesterase [Myxococcota bacterium]
MNEFPENIVEMLNEALGGYDKTMGLRFTHAEPEKFVAEMDIDDRHRQPYGLIHGGVYAAMVETLCSTAAAVHVIKEGKSAVGLENTTSFLRATRSGKIRCTVRPQVMGRRSHVWAAEIHDGDDRLVATGKLRLMILEPESKVGGKFLSMP